MTNRFRTQLVCLCEGENDSIDRIFINKLFKTLKPSWLRPWGSNILEISPCGSRSELLKRMPEELRRCCNAGGQTTLMVWADLDDDRTDGDALKEDFWIEAQQNNISREEFDTVVFIFAKDRIENWIEFLETGTTDESKEAPRIRVGRRVSAAAVKLAKICSSRQPCDPMPPSLTWSCNNWRELKRRIR